MPRQRTVAAGVNISAGSDFGGGDEWLISLVLAHAFKVHISGTGDAGVSMHPAEMLSWARLAVRGRWTWRIESAIWTLAGGRLSGGGSGRRVDQVPPAG